MQYKKIKKIKKVTAAILSAILVVTGLPQSANAVYAAPKSEAVEAPGTGYESASEDESANTDNSEAKENIVEEYRMEESETKESEIKEFEIESNEAESSEPENSDTGEIYEESTQTQEYEAGTTEVEQEKEDKTQDNESQTECLESSEEEITEIMGSEIAESEVISVPVINESVYVLEDANEILQIDALSITEDINLEYTEIEALAIDANGTYIIENKDQFITFLASDKYKDATVKLNCDVNMNEDVVCYQWGFGGNFNGNGHSIYNLSVDTSIFSSITADAVVENVHISNVKSTGNSSCGIVASENRGTILNCVVSGNLISTSKAKYMAGIVVDNKGIVKNCVFNGSVTADADTDNNAKYIAGIAGTNNGEISNCYSMGSISTNAAIVAGVAAENYGDIVDCANYMDVEGAYSVAGIVAENQSRGCIENCTNYGDIIQKSTSDEAQAAGIVGGNKGQIINSYNYGDITGKSSNIAGIAGYSSKSIESCGNYGTITGKANVGGIVGLYNGSTACSIQKCFNKGNIKGIQTNTEVEAVGIGGIIGSSSTKASINIVNSYVVANIQAGAGNNSIGGIVGVLPSGKIENCYFAGDIVAAEDKCAAMIAGFLAGTDESTATYTNCLFVDGLNDSAEYVCYKASGAVTDDAAKKTEDELKAAADILGEAYVVDNDNINSGYPILSGQTNKACKYLVVYELNGGCLDKYYDIVSAQNKVSTPTTPTKMNSTFLGWYTDATLKTAYDFSKGITSDTVLYAKWDSYVAVENMELMQDSVTLIKDEVYTINVKFTPSDAVNTDMVWESSDTNIAAVDEKGIVTAVSTGEATITGKIKDNSLAKVLTFKVKVSADENNVRIRRVSDKVDVTALSVAVNSPEEVEIVFGKQPTTEYSIKWSSTNEKIVTIKESDTYGKKRVSIEGLKQGNAIVTVAVEIGSGAEAKSYVKSMDVTVLPIAKTVNILINDDFATDKEVIYDLVTEKFIAIGNVKLKKATDELTAMVLPSDASQNVEWTSSDTSIIRFEDKTSGKVTGNAQGTVTLTASALDGSKVTGKTTVITKRIVQSFELVPTKISDNSVPVVKDENGRVVLTAGNSIKLVPDFNPVDATDKRMSWKISDTNAIEIDAETKKVTAKNVASNTKVTVTATSFDEGKATATIEFIIKPKVEEIKLYKDGNKTTPVNGKVIGINPEKDAKTFVLQTKNYPEDASQSVTWKSGNKNIATVTDNKDGSCIVEIKNGGKTSIKATATDGSGISASITVNVAALVSDVQISGSSKVMKGKSITLKAEVFPKSAANKAVKWKSLTPSYASVDENGKVTGKLAGIAIIRATAADGSGKFDDYKVKVTDTIKSFNVMQPDGNTDSNDDIIMTNKSVGLDPDCGLNTYTLVPRILPNTACQDVTWKSSNEKVATVKDGVITAVGLGTAKVTACATDGSGKKASVTVNVTTLVKSVAITGSHYIINGKAIQLKATVGEADAKNKKVNWSSEYPTIASVDKNGNVTAHGTGYTTITAEAADGSGVKAQHKIYILGKSNKLAIDTYDKNCTIKLDKDNIKYINVDMSKNASLMFKAELSQGSDPKNEFDMDMKWSTSDKGIAKVEITSCGEKYSIVTVTFVKAGKVTIAATAADGSGAKDKIVMNVSESEPKVDITGPAQMAKGKKITLSTGNTKVVWSSSDKSIATINDKGEVIAKKEGTVKIKALAVGGSNYDYHVLNVKPAVSKVDILADGKNITGTKVGIDYVDVRSVKLEADVTGNDSDEVTWKSGNTAIATVDKNGQVTIKKTGNVSITATARDGSGKKAKVTLAVAKQVTQINPVNTRLAEPVQAGISKVQVGYKKGVQINLSYLPYAATTKKVVWKSEAPKVVSVSSTGVITAKSYINPELYPNGYITVTATAADKGGAMHEFRVYVTSPVHKLQVIKSGNTYASLVGVDIDSEPIYLDTILTDKNKATISGQNVTWKTSDSQIATIDTDGKLTGHKKGKVTITATSMDGSKKSGKITVYVGTLVTDLDIDDTMEEGVTIKKGKSMNLSNGITISPMTATKQTLKYTTSNKSIVAVNTSGKITGKKVGKAIITVSTTDGSRIIKQIEVTVTR